MRMYHRAAERQYVANILTQQRLAHHVVVRAGVGACVTLENIVKDAIGRAPTGLEDRCIDGGAKARLEARLNLRDTSGSYESWSKGRPEGFDEHLKVKQMPVNLEFYARALEWVDGKSALLR